MVLTASATGAVRIDRYDQAEKIFESMCDSRVRQFVTGAPTFGYCHHQAASAQAGKVIRQGLP